MANKLSYRVGYVNQPQLPFERVVKVGIKHLEIVMTQEETPDQVLAIIEPFGLSVSTIHAHPTPLGDDSLYEVIDRFSASAAALGASGLFVSMLAGETPLEEAYARMRRAGEIAASHGVVIAMETHEDLCENGDKAVRTLEAVNHPAVGWNLDTANIYYYNENVNSVDEARKAARWVRSVHAKDTTGGFHDPNFPNLGEGVVDFAGVGAVLAEVGFAGPWTMELEGVAGAADSVDQMEANVRTCADHLRNLGLAE